MGFMVELEDFTAFAVGSDGPEGRVGCCPECGRNGVRHQELDGTFYVHTQASEVLSDGMLTEPRDCCRVPLTVIPRSVATRDLSFPRRDPSLRSG